MANRRLIDANALLELVQFRSPIDNQNAEVIAGCVDITRRLIENASTVDAVEVVHGKWDAVFEYEDFQYAYCSACGKRSEYMTNYCPNCGAKMDGGNEYG